ncbi:MAG: DUF3078 domain-containing protein, partial [Bacteroidales bacterium]|nr:DUF3078 domain-containing protein [Bacteroidales bacterium]
MRRLIIIFSLVSFMTSLSAQDKVDLTVNELDTISPDTLSLDMTSVDTIIFTTESASKYLRSLVEMDSLWRDNDTKVKYSLERLLNRVKEPFDSVSRRLTSFQFDSINFSKVAFVKSELHFLRWLNDSAFIFSKPNLDRDPFVVEKLIVMREDTLGSHVPDTLPSSLNLLDSVKMVSDTIKMVPDTILNMSIDFLYLDSMRVQLYTVSGHEIYPPIVIPEDMTYLTFLPDTSGLIFSDTTWALVANEESPFYILPNEKVADSLRYAVEKLLNYTLERDSVPLLFSDINGSDTQFWIGMGDEDLHRFWVKNYRNDSITLWVGNPSRRNISFFLEDEVNINRMKKRKVEDLPFTLVVPETSLAPMTPLNKLPKFWEFDLATSFAFSQTLLSQYWSKGGQSSISTLLDIKGEANYNNTEEKSKWINNVRIKYGSILSGGNGFRTNSDVFEINSQYNKLLKGKFDFSSTFYMKNQIAEGYNYPNDSVTELVSKFLNPGTFTIGVGAEYKPFKSTVINYSPLSYKNTFVLDTAAIDQTNHGIEDDKRNKQELGGQLVMKTFIVFG